VKTSTKPDATDTNVIAPNSKTLPWEGDSKAMSYLEAVATRPRQCMNAMMVDVVKTSKDSGDSGGSTNHKNANSQTTSQGNLDEGRNIPLGPSAVHGPADTLLTVGSGPESHLELM
jgi:hypothetical protein